MRWRFFAVAGLCALCGMSARPVCGAGTGGEIAPAFQYVHLTFPRAVSFAARAPRLALSGSHGVVDIWNTRTWERLRSFDANGGRLKPGDQVAAGALSPDGKTWALVTYLNQVLLWNTDTGAFEKQLSGPGGPPNNTGPDATVAWTSDGQRLFTNNGMARLWDARSDRLIRKFPGQGAGAISPDGRMVATSGFETVSLYDVATGKLRCTLKDAVGVSEPIAFSPDGRYIATSGEDPGWSPPAWPDDAPRTEAYYDHPLKIKIWDRRTGGLLRLLPGLEPYGGPEALAYTADGKRLFLKDGDFGFRVINARTGKTAFHSRPEGGSGISPDGRLIAVGDRYDTRVLNAATGRRIKTLRSAPLAVRALAFSPDGRTLASSTWLGERLWNADHARLLRSLPDSQAETTGMFFLPNGNLVTEDLNSVWLYNGRTGDRMLRVPSPPIPAELPGDFNDATWSRLLPNGRALLVSTVNNLPNRLQVRDFVTRKTIASCPIGLSDVGSAVLSPDSRSMALGGSSSGSAVEIVDLATDATVAGPDQMEKPLAFSPDGRLLLGVMARALPESVTAPPTTQTLGLWQVGSGGATATLQTPLPSRDIGKAAATFAPNGTLLAVGSGTDVRILDGRTLAPLDLLNRGDAPVTALAFSPDGKRLAVGDEGGRIRLYNVASRKLLVTMVGFPTRDGSKVSPDWFAGTPDGFYAWPDSAAPLIRFRKDGKMYPASAFEKTLRKQDLLGG